MGAAPRSVAYYYDEEVGLLSKQRPCKLHTTARCFVSSCFPGREWILTTFAQVGNVNYGGGNPMRPHRVRLTHTLVDTYGLKNNMSVHRPQHASQTELASFHADGAAVALANIHLLA